MEVVKVTPENFIHYNNFLKEQLFCSFLQCSDWGAWQEEQGRKVLRFLFLDGSLREVLGTAQVVLMKTPMGNYFYSPYGPVFKKDLSEEIVNNILAKLINVLKLEDKILFVRVEPTTVLDLKKFGGMKAESVQPPQTLIKNISVSEEELLKSFHTKTRYNIKVAQKHGVEIKTFEKFCTQSGDEVTNAKAVVDLIMKTSSRHGYRNHSSSYIEKLWEFFSTLNGKEISVLGYLAEKNGQAIASGLMVDFANTRMYLFGGSEYTARNFMGPYLLHWQAMLDAKAKGFSFYDFGALEDASGHSGGYMRFKMGFNPEITEFSGTYDFVVNKSKYSLFKVLRKFNRLRLHLPFVK